MDSYGFVTGSPRIADFYRGETPMGLVAALFAHRRSRLTALAQPRRSRSLDPLQIAGGNTAEHTSPPVPPADDAPQQAPHDSTTHSAVQFRPSPYPSRPRRRQPPPSSGYKNNRPDDAFRSVAPTLSRLVLSSISPTCLAPTSRIRTRGWARTTAKARPHPLIFFL